MHIRANAWTGLQGMVCVSVFVCLCVCVCEYI